MYIYIYIQVPEKNELLSICQYYFVKFASNRYCLLTSEDGLALFTASATLYQEKNLYFVT